MKKQANGSTAPEAAALVGVNVVSIAVNLPGPACARRLADFGATVIKVEPPEQLGGDPMHHYARSYYDELHRGIEVKVLDLKTETGRGALLALLKTADVLLTSQRGAALARLGLAWETLAAQFPKLNHVAIAGSVSEDNAGHDLTYVAVAGLATPPHLPPTLLADLGGAERAVAATFAALRLSQRDGHGHRIVVSLENAAGTFAGPHRHGLTDTGGLLAGKHPGYNFYRASDGWIALAALEPHFAARVQAASGVSFTRDALAAYFLSHDLQHWTGWAAENDIPLAAIPHAPSSPTSGS
ncbi:MAG: CaiB/BaiF CoA-transferase family protein [Betaproteobacteria bacterium]